MGRIAKGKSRFYKQLNVDNETKKIIRFFNKHLDDWKNGKLIFLSREKDEEE